jgi:cyanuric acid amidohydrolase
MPNKVSVFRVEMQAPDDLSQLQQLVEAGALRPEEIVAIICKTEGNGRMNDFTRAFATETFKHYLSEQLGLASEEVSQRVALVMSGGCEGVMTPHAAVFTRRHTPLGSPSPGKRLAVGIGSCRLLKPEEIGRMTQVQLVAEATQQAMQDASIDDPNDVHYVQTKGPILTAQRINDALTRGQTVATTDTYKSMGLSNGASALGVASALGEIAPEQLSDAVICQRGDLFSTVASCSAGVELMNCQVVVIGNVAGSASNLVVGHAVLEDLLDVHGVLAALTNAGLKFTGYPSAQDLEGVEAVFVKALTAQTGDLRGYRTTLLTDLDLGTRPARAVGNAVVASVLGDPMIYVSAGWGFHQGPMGGGVVAVILRLGDTQRN